MRVLVCGGRDYADAETVGAWLGGIHKDHGIAVIIHGGATGADTLAAKFAEWKGIQQMPFPVTKEEWRRIGPAAGPLRNARMLAEGKPDLVVAFPGGKGTADMVRRAEAAGVRVLKVAGPTPRVANDA